MGFPMTVKELSEKLDDFGDDDQIFIQVNGRLYSISDLCDTDDPGSLWMEVVEATFT